MKSKVKVTADEAGNVIIKTKNPDYGYIRVEQTKMVLDGTGFARKKTLAALVPGEIEDLKMFGWTAGQEIEGNIVVKESLQPFNKKDPDRDFKVAGESGIVCTLDDQPIYRKHVYTFNSSVEDTLIEHNNDQEIKAWYEVNKEEMVEQGDEDFNV